MAAEAKITKIVNCNMTYNSLYFRMNNVGQPTNWTRIVSKRGLVKISVIETDTATSGPV
jgi:hypothetical protein